MINVESSGYRPTISPVGTTTDEVALERVDEMRRLVDKHFFTQIRLGIALSGGLDTALARGIQPLLEHWEAGVRVVTRARANAASTAAVLRSMGHRRITAPGARLVHHHERAVGANVISGPTARRIAERARRNRTVRCVARPPRSAVLACAAVPVLRAGR